MKMVCSGALWNTALPETED